jgi:hypothetical protein
MRIQDGKKFGSKIRVKHPGSATLCDIILRKRIKFGQTDKNNEQILNTTCLQINRKQINLLQFNRT